MTPSQSTIIQFQCLGLRNIINTIKTDDQDSYEEKHLYQVVFFDNMDIFIN